MDVFTWAGVLVHQKETALSSRPIPISIPVPIAITGSSFFLLPSSFSPVIMC